MGWIVHSVCRRRLARWRAFLFLAVLSAPAPFRCCSRCCCCCGCWCCVCSCFCCCCCCCCRWPLLLLLSFAVAVMIAGDVVVVEALSAPARPCDAIACHCAPCFESQSQRR